MSTNEWEERARATKAYKIARILSLSDVGTLDEWRAASTEVRERVATIARVRVPSDQTWAMACDLLHQMIEQGDTMPHP